MNFLFGLLGKKNFTTPASNLIVEMNHLVQPRREVLKETIMQEKDILFKKSAS